VVRYPRVGPMGGHLSDIYDINPSSKTAEKTATRRSLGGPTYGQIMGEWHHYAHHALTTHREDGHHPKSVTPGYTHGREAVTHGTYPVVGRQGHLQTGSREAYRVYHRVYIGRY